LPTAVVDRRLSSLRKRHGLLAAPWSCTWVVYHKLAVAHIVVVDLAIGSGLPIAIEL